MGTKEKLLKRLMSKPKDFTFEELETLLKYMDYACFNKGRTSGSRVLFVNKSGKKIALHKPHPQNTLKQYQLKELINSLEEEGLL